MRSVSNSNLEETLSDDTDEETADNVFNCTNDEAQEDKERYKDTKLKLCLNFYQLYNYYRKFKNIFPLALLNVKL